MAPPLKKFKSKKSGLKDVAFKDPEEYNSEIFKIQVEELLKEININIDLNDWISTFQDFLRSCKETSQFTIDECLSNVIYLPIIKKNRGKGNFKFIPPEKISIVGSYEQQTACCVSLPYVLDMSVEIPKACWQGMDFLNERYHRKRSLYLAYIAQSLLDAEFVEEMKFTFQDDCHLKPILLITPKGIKEQIVISLTAYPNENAFKLLRFIPSRNNVRSSWLLGYEEEVETPTPYYNSTVLADILLPDLNEYLKNSIIHENIKNGIKLVKLWLHQRELLTGYGRLNGFIISMYVAYLLKKQKINCFMNPYQVFRCILLALQHENFAEGISLADEYVEQAPLENFKVFPGVFLDPSGYLNLLYSVNKETLDMVKHEAKIGMNILESEVPSCFNLLFMKKTPPLEKFEYLIHLKGPKKFRKYSRKLCNAQDHLNFGENKFAAVIPKICDILRKGLNERILMLDVFKSTSSDYCMIMGKASDISPGKVAVVNCLIQENHYTQHEISKKANILQASWSIFEKPPSPNCGLVTIGVLLNPDTPLSNIEKGPPADDPEAKEFRKFWGDQSELRRFQDGTIREAVYWPANTFEDKRRVLAQMIKDILKRHLYTDESKFKVNGCNVDNALHIPNQVLSSGFSPYGTGEEAHVTLMESFNLLSKELRKLDGLPLQISSIQGIAPAFHYADVFPPLPISFFSDSSQIKLNPMKKKKMASASISRLPSFIPALNVIIEFEGSGKWPNDIVGIRKLKTIFLIQIAELVKSQYSLSAVPFLTHTDIVKDGYVFRLSISSHKELYLMKLHTLPNGMTKIQDTEESKQLDLTINILPKLNSLLHGLQLQHFTYGTACRLAKRWVASQLKDDYIDNTAVELLVAHVYIHPEPYTCPSSPQCAFIRFLSLLINHDWNINPLVVNLNNELQKKDIEEIYTSFTDQRSTLPPMVIATPFDKRGTLWTKNNPQGLILKRIVILAKASLKILQSRLFSVKECDVKCVFRPPLQSFDMIIHFNHNMIPKLFYAVDADRMTDLPSLKAFDKEKDKGYPTVEFDVPKVFYEQLKDTYGEFAHFFYDVYGGDFIGVVWKKSAFIPKELKTSHMNCRVALNDSNQSIIGCRELIIQDIKLLGSGLIKCVTNQKELEIP